MQEANGPARSEQTVPALSPGTTAYAQNYLAGLERRMEELIEAAKKGPLSGFAARDEYGRLKYGDDGRIIMVTPLDTVKQEVADVRAALEASRQGEHRQLGKILDTPLSRDARAVARELAGLDAILAPRPQSYDADRYRELNTYRDPSGTRRLYQPSNEENEGAVKMAQERQETLERAQRSAEQYRGELERIRGMRTELGLPS